MKHEEREKRKDEAWKLFSRCESPEQRATILLNGVATPHYWRAREKLESRRDERRCLMRIVGKRYVPGYELDIDHYIPHWMFSQKDAPFMKDGTFEALCEFYTPKESKYLPSGCTEYQI